MRTQYLREENETTVPEKERDTKNEEAEGDEDEPISFTDFVEQLVGNRSQGSSFLPDTSGLEYKYKSKAIEGKLTEEKVSNYPRETRRRKDKKMNPKY